MSVEAEVETLDYFSCVHVRRKKTEILIMVRQTKPTPIVNKFRFTHLKRFWLVLPIELMSHHGWTQEKIVLRFHFRCCWGLKGDKVSVEVYPQKGK